MKIPTVSFRRIPVTLLLIAGLLSTTACTGGSAHHSSHGKPGYAHAGGSDAGTSPHGGHHGGRHKQHDGDRHAMNSSGHGQPHAKKHGGHGRRAMQHNSHQDAAQFIDHVLKFQDGMSLTDDQAQQLRALKTMYRKTRITLKAEIKLANVDLHEILKDTTASLSDIEAHLNTVHAVKTRLYLASITAKRQANAVLSEEQQSRMNTIHERIKSHGGNMAHQGGHAGYRKHGAPGQP